MTSSTKKVEQNLRKNIRKYRKMLGFTQLQLSIKADVSKDFIYDLEDDDQGYFTNLRLGAEEVEAKNQKPV